MPSLLWSNKSSLSAFHVSNNNTANCTSADLDGINFTGNYLLTPSNSIDFAESPKICIPSIATKCESTSQITYNHVNVLLIIEKIIRNCVFEI